MRACYVADESLVVTGMPLHPRVAAGLDRLHELGARGEREILAAPQPEALGVGEIVDRGGTGGGDVEDSRVRQGVLQAQARATLLRGRLVAALAFAAGGVGHGVALVE